MYQETPEMLAPELGSTNSGSVTSIPGVTVGNSSEKLPLIAQRRLFGRLGSWNCCSNPFGGRSGNADSTSRTLGTFAGVFSPVALSMFSALLFLRVGFIVGNAGLLVTLLQFVIAYGILLFTVASVCAVSTNGAVEGGGAYFMISRTLGPEFGGSIGTLFFLANIVSSALYITGCAEGLVENFGPSGYLVSSGAVFLPDGRWWRFLYCSSLNAAALAVCLVGASMFARTSVATLALVTMCLLCTLLSFFIQHPLQVVIPDANQLVQNATYHVFGNYTGLSSKTLKDNLFPEYGRDYTTEGQQVNFAAVFGVLFSGVTGIMAGANMSGDLKDPSKSIPRGTLSAVAFTFVTYAVVSLLTAATCQRFLLGNNFAFMTGISFFPPSVAIGLLTATFSASLSNLIGASRVLEALAKDNVFGGALGWVVRGTRRGNPVVAVVLSWLLVQLILLIGSLNLIAQINSVLFLLSYLATNLACLGLELASAPNFRPSFKYFSWHTAFIGLVGTLIMMFVINSIYAFSSIILCLLLVIMLHLFSPSRAANWGSISQALIFHQVRKYLLMLDSRKDHVKFWRPQMLLMVANPRSCCPLISFVNDLKKGGLYVLGHVLVSPPSAPGEDGASSKIPPLLPPYSAEYPSGDPTLREHPHWLALIDHLKVKAFVELTVARSVREGLHHLIRISGLGAMKPNTIVFGFLDDEPPKDFFCRESSYHTDIFNSHEARVLEERSGGWRESEQGIRQRFSLRHHPTPEACTLAPRRLDGEEDESLMEEGERPSEEEFVSMVWDVLWMRKNVCVCRHFHLLDKSAIAKSRNVKRIDVWPINFFHPDSVDFDTTSLFMLQLACIINMVPGWKSLRLRVLLCEQSIPRQSSSNQEGETEPAQAQPGGEKQLRKLLQMLRIAADIETVAEWGVVEALLPRKPGAMVGESEWMGWMNEENPALADEMEKYLGIVNGMLRRASDETVLSFVYLPPPPPPRPLQAYEGGESAPNNLHTRYLSALRMMTEGLPPTVLVHGVSLVTSTTL
ncbi:solute carrier family 12 member 9 isoform X2 [Ischnura elegans]|nr:solute carrier family 12 member 9 isoform X2 [Ischnura elegans]XP_046388302.1 solute carrier family 12 member 9 isoform X2 [Ischnura elegans]XP_046388303.1 solute carrier family 12 member 9 isoform X2 [Ischnura elegans]XP_046388305.1 solute carrier family 12 member 9 isoform X2 [Ischnura elegans]